MSLGPAVRAASRTLIARPTEVLPAYVAGLAVPAVTQAVSLAGLVAAFFVLASTGGLGAVRTELEAYGPIPLDDPEALQGEEDALAEAVVDALAGSLTPTSTLLLLAILLLTPLAAVLVAILVSAVVSAGRFHAVYATVTARPATPAAVDGAFRHWQTFLALVLLELLAFLAALTAFLVLVSVLAAISPVLGVFAALGAGVAWMGASILLRLTFAFARPAAVVDDVGVSEALRGAFGQITDRPLESFGYGLLAVVAFVTVGVVAGVFNVLGAPTVGSLLFALAVFPLLDCCKTVLYADGARKRLTFPTSPRASPARRFRGTVGSGLRSLSRFAFGHPVSVLASAALFAAGILLGLRLGGQVDDLFVASIEGRLDQINPVGSFFEYAANNWTVAVAGAFSGLAFGIPTIVVLVFNGINIGLFYEFETDPEILLAFVAPHGLLEIPALVLSGALGLHLGVVALRYGSGSIDRRRLAREVDRAFRVVVGLGVLVLGAALIEAFVSPYYWRFLGI